ncbi:unnamed protein product [Owenia fusiformis]|uniref:Uncharacterized protein n=1 Tax=Owenia fusiformis TaxID=6347 RepID=A0A8J1TLN5_OWEFU|nr:unnamed protein product [Owenia fusiformis]
MTERDVEMEENEDGDISGESDAGSEPNDMSEDDNDSGEDDDDKHSLKIQELEAQITSNPYMYDPHVELISLLRAEGELTKLREARERMSNIFPLTEKLWLEWLKDEVPLAADSPSERIRINGLFDRAVNDYMSVSVWLEYVQYSIGGLASEDGLANTRQVFERALVAVGLHVSKGAHIWEAYREFELAILAGLQPAPGSTATTEQQEKLDDQVKKISTLFRRQLAVPLIDMEATWTEYVDFVDEVDSYVEQTYKKALARLQKLMPFEDSLDLASSPSLEDFQKYIEFESKDGEPARIQCIYERTITVHCLIPELWLQYLNYLDSKLKIPTVIFSVYERASRNCPWSVGIWQGYLRAAERHTQPEDKTKEIFDKGLQGGFAESGDYLQLWHSYIDYIRRTVNWEEDHTESLEKLRTTFDQAIEYMQNAYGVEGDPECSLHKYRAWVEAKYCNNMEKCRQLWNDIMVLGHGAEANMWIEFFNIERTFGDPKHCRKVLQRGINSANDFPDLVCEAYIKYEREEGTLEQFDLATQKCHAQLERIKERRLKAAEKEELGKEHKKQPKQKQTKQAKQQQHQNKQQKFQKQDTKEKYQKSATQEKQGMKRKYEDQSTNEASSKETGDGFQASKAPVSKSPPPGFKAPAPPGFKAPASKAPPPGYKGPPPPGFKGPPPPGFKGPPPPGYKGDEPAAKKLKEDTHESSSTKAEDPGKNNAAHDPSDHNKDLTVFVSNLGYDITVDKIREKFTQVGDLSDIRLVKDYKGRSKGFCYVEFKQFASVAEALKLDRQPIDGRPMFVSPFQKDNRNKLKFDTGLERNKLFVKNLPNTTTKEALENIFKQHGILKEVRLVTYRNGASKGMAYIEYEDQADASTAMLKTDGLEIGDKTISVAISNPPPRKMPMKDRTFAPSLGGGKKQMEDRKARTQVSFMPRSVHKPSSTVTSKSSSVTSQSSSVTSSSTLDSTEQKPQATAGMSNADFRNLLLKK